MNSEHIIETERCLLRKFQPSDAEMMYELNLHPDILRFTTDPPFKSVADAGNFLKNYEGYLKPGFGRFAVVRKSDQSPIGWCGLKFIESEDEVDVGYRLLPSVWGQGYAPETAKACCNYGFNELGLERIVARIHKENERSVKVVKKIGMIYEKDLLYDGVMWLNYIVTK